MKMDAQSEEILDFQTTKFMTVRDVLRKSIDIARSSPKIFFHITLTLILPLSFAILAHSRFTIPLLDIIPIEEPVETNDTRHPQLQLFIFMYGYPVFLFVFSLLSTAAVVFTAASLYTHRSVSFTSTLSAIPGVFKRLFITFLFVAMAMLVYNAVYFAFLIILVRLVNLVKHPYVFWFLFFSFFIIFLMIHVYISAIWHLASVISVLEPIYGLGAMKKSKKLLSGKTMMGMKLVLAYLCLCVATNIAYSQCNLTLGVAIRYSLRLLLVAVLVIVNLVGLLVQSIFYFLCKSFHGEEIDKSVLYENLGGYLGEYMPLQRDKEVKNSEVEIEVMEGKL